ncbi:hypothetical protein DFH06DRAFT_1132547 [Mycena polygramma]|nr:hypothetical protein DFH06DRAFT_1132547 [Mycena polygramma]
MHSFKRLLHKGWTTYKLQLYYGTTNTHKKAVTSGALVHEQEAKREASAPTSHEAQSIKSGRVSAQKEGNVQDDAATRVRTGKKYALQWAFVKGKGKCPRRRDELEITGEADKGATCLTNLVNAADEIRGASGDGGILITEYSIGGLEVVEGTSESRLGSEKDIKEDQSRLDARELSLSMETHRRLHHIIPPSSPADYLELEMPTTRTDLRM